MNPSTATSASAGPQPAGRVTWVGPALVAAALVAVVVVAIVFVRTSIDELPVYLADRWFVLDATSMLFLLVIDSVFLGISVYMSSRVATWQLSSGQVLNSQARLLIAERYWWATARSISSRDLA